MSKGHIGRLQPIVNYKTETTVDVLMFKADYFVTKKPQNFTILRYLHVSDAVLSKHTYKDLQTPQ